MNPKLILSFCALLAWASVAFGAGEYQQARDGKTTIWNWIPKAGETGSWSGDRDKEGYASGFGDLTWYNANGKVLGLYFGNMVHGRFEGAANVHVNGRVMHAYFVDGERVTGWARGAAKSKMTAPEAAVVEKRKAETEKLAAKKGNTERAAPVTAPVEKKEGTEKIAKAEAIQSPAERAARGAETYHKETAEKPKPVAEKKSEPLSAEEELNRTERSTSTSSSGTFVEPTPLPKSQAETRITESVASPTARPSEPERELKESSPPAIEETPPVLHGPVTEEKPPIANQPPEASRESAAAPVKKETPADVSLNALTGPPSSLRTDTTPASSPENRETESAPRNRGPLSESEATSLADAEVRLQGIQLDHYEPPKVDHSAVKGKWSLFYTLKKGEGGRDSPPAFSATVEDKTRKVEIRK